MMAGAVFFFAAHLGLPALGFAAAFHPALRRGPAVLRLGAAFIAGAVALTLEAMLWSLVGVPWSVGSLALPVILLSLVAAWAFARRPAAAWEGGRPSPALSTAALLAAAGGLTQLAVAAITARAGASDLLLFWGVKALHWAAARSLDAAALAGPFAVHTHPSYPPLYPVVLAWSTLAAGELPWLWVPLASLVWVAPAAALVFCLLAPRVGADHAVAVAGFWSVATCAALAASCSAGNAEPPLLLFETVALAAVLGERGAGEGGTRFLAALALVGAVLTKNEGAVTATLLVAGVVARDWRRGRRVVWRSLSPLAVAPVAAGLAWLLVRCSLGLPLTDPIREPAFHISLAHVGAILAAAPNGLAAGTRGLVWLVPAAILLVKGRRRLPELAPALAVVAGLLLFLFVYYLHAVGDPARLIGWTLPRVSIPALSALILAAGVAGAPEPRGGEQRVSPPRGAGCGQ